MPTLILINRGSAPASDKHRCSIRDSTPPRLVAFYIPLSTVFFLEWERHLLQNTSINGATAVHAPCVQAEQVKTPCYNLFIQNEGWLTKMAKQGFHPPSICCCGSKPLESFSCNDECHTFEINPPGMPSNVWPFGIDVAELSQWARPVALADW